MRLLRGHAVHGFVLPLQLEMNKKTRTLTLGALFSALTVIILYVASIWPTGQLGLVAVASLFTAAAVIETGLISGVYVYIVCSVLGLLIIPDRVAVFLYILFLGYYPVVKSIIERNKRTVVQWVLKLLVFNSALFVIWFFVMRAALGFAGGLSPGYVTLLFLGGNVAFVVFDFGFTKLIWFYITRISRRT